ncbi:MAG: hypothetical protein ACJA1C_002214 [Crocinitomicaceae bacterium]|jgi:hypothetical protein
MVRQILIIADIIDLNDGNLILGVSLGDFESKEIHQLKSNTEVKNEFVGKFLLFDRTKVSGKIEIIDVQITSSIVDFKNIFFKVKKTKKVEALKVLDEVSINM